MYARLQPRTEWLTSIDELDEDSEVALELFGYLHLDWRVHIHSPLADGALVRAC